MIELVQKETEKKGGGRVISLFLAYLTKTLFLCKFNS